MGESPACGVGFDRTADASRLVLLCAGRREAPPFIGAVALILVPGRSFAAFKSVAAVATNYVVIGPIAEGGWVAGAWCTVTADAAVVAEVAATIGESSTADAQTLAAGVSLIQKSDVLIGAVPALRRTFSATGGDRHTRSQITRTEKRFENQHQGQ